jgi:hypothetical protein
MKREKQDFPDLPSSLPDESVFCLIFIFIPTLELMFAKHQHQKTANILS